MSNANQITQIEVIFSKGNFEEWTEASGDSFPEAFVAEWEANYNNIIKEKLAKSFPKASIEVGEGYDQTGSTIINVEVEGAYQDEDDWQTEIEYMIEIGSDAEALDAVWATPSVEAISQAITDLVDEKPVGRLEYEGADYVFARHDGAIHWLDLDVEEVLNPEAEWLIGLAEDAAIAFRGEFDPDYKLITQAQAVALGAPSIQAVNQAIRDGRLKSYENPKSQGKRQGRTLVSRQEIIKLWGGHND